MRLVRLVVSLQVLCLSCGSVPPDGSDAGAEVTAGGRAGGRSGGGAAGSSVGGGSLGGGEVAGGTAGGSEQAGGGAGGTTQGGGQAGGGLASAGGSSQGGGQAGGTQGGGLAVAGGSSQGGGQAGSFSLMVAPSTLNIAQGSSRSVVISLVRSNVFDPVSVSLAPGTPASITAAPLTIQGSSGQLQLSIGATQPVGALDVVLTATAGAISEVASLHLVVLDGVAPTVVSTVPANQATGVRREASVTITFSEPMDIASVQQAFSSSMGTVAFSWNAAHTEVTASPSSPLAYAPLNATQPYTFQLANTATDVAGNGLLALSVTFFTLRTTELLLSSVAATDGYLIDDRFNSGTAQAFTVNPNLIVGDSATNRQITSWVSFDLSLVPVARASDLLGAELVLPLFQTIGMIDASLCPSSASCVMYSPANYGPQLGVGAYSTTLASRTPMVRQQIGVLTLFKHDVLSETLDAWNNRAPRSSRLQFEIELVNPNNGNSRADYYEFTSGDGSQTTCPYVRVTALLP